MSLALLTLAALGIQMSWRKGDRGTDLVWIGMKFSVRWAEGILYNEVPKKMQEELAAMLYKCGQAGKISVSALRTLVGKLSWTTSIYKRARWTISVIYKALTQHLP